MLIILIALLAFLLVSIPRRNQTKKFEKDQEFQKFYRYTNSISGSKSKRLP